MTLSALIAGKAAIANPAIPATQPMGEAATVARIATVAVANPTDDELRLLVPAVVRASGGDHEEESYCLALALADPVDALRCYRLLADELGIEPWQLSGNTNTSPGTRGRLYGDSGRPFAWRASE